MSDDEISMSSSLIRLAFSTEMKVVVYLLLFCMIVAAYADKPFFASCFGDHQVLQRGAPIKIWGWATPYGRITCRFKDSVASGNAGGDGKWMVTLVPQQASSIGSDLTCAGDISRTLHDILIGDVYMCGGQSNMMMGVKAVTNAAALEAEADSLPGIRLFTVGQGTYSDVPLDNLATIRQPWTVASSAAIGNDVWTYFSAVCYEAGRNIHVNVLGRQVPVGLISTNWDGTYLPAWMPGKESMATCRDYKVMPDYPNKPTVLYNAMIHPFIGISLSGFMWYQGESDADRGVHHDDGPAYYSCAFPEFIRHLRTRLGMEKLPFFFVQLAPYSINSNERTENALSLPYTCMATAVDLGDSTSPYHSLHPRNKEHIAERLMNCARIYIYNDARAIINYPSGQRATQYNPTGTVVNVVMSEAVMMVNTPYCPVNTTECCSWQYIHNGVQKVVMTSPTLITLTATEHMEAISYGVCDWPLLSMYGVNDAHLPAVPFALVVTP